MEPTDSREWSEESKMYRGAESTQLLLLPQLLLLHPLLLLLALLLLHPLLQPLLVA